MIILVESAILCAIFTLMVFVMSRKPIDEEKEEGFYLPVQRVCRPNHTFRGFQGQIEAGSVNVGDEITVLPSNEKANVKSIHLLNKTVDEAAIGQPVTIQIDREVDVSRGCVLTKDTSLQVATSFEVTLLWMDDERLELGKNIFVKLGTKLIPGVVTSIRYAIDVNTGEKREVSSLNKNEIAVCELKLADSIVIDVFKKHRTLGELILIDRVSNMTSACGVVTQLYKSDNANTVTEIDRETRSQWKGQRAITVEIPLSEDGFDLEFIKKVERELSNQGRHTYLYAPDSSHGVKGVIRHLNDAGILVLFAANSSIDTSVFDTTRGYYSNWFDKNMTVEEVASFIYRASSIHGDTAIVGDYI